MLWKITYPDGHSEEIEWDGILPSPQPEGTEMEVAWPTPAPSVVDARTQMASDFAGLPLEVKVAFADLYNDADRFLDLGQWDVAIALVAARAVPPELAAVKAGFLAKLTAAKPTV